MSQITEYIKIAIRNILNSKGRSFLTMLGIIIGIMSVILVITVGNAVAGSVSGELEGIGGGGVINIYCNDGYTGREISFDNRDFEYLMERIDHIRGITPISGWYGSCSGPKGNFTLIANIGNHALQYYYSDPIIRGRYFTEEENLSGAPVCVIGESGARAMFGTDDVVGLTFDADFYGQTLELKIIGVRKDSSAQLINITFGGDTTVNAETPYNAVAGAFGLYEDSFRDIYIFPESPIYAPDIAKQAMNLLNARKDTRDTDALMIQSFTDVTEEINNVLGYVTLFVSLVAAISLLVGGIGVMNIMLVSVTERTREIGIRKALGARTSSILMQFLAEAAIITLLGGITGIILGIGIATVICNAIGFTATIDWGVVLIATLFSSAVGLFFGIYPARKAAKLRPIDALRYE